MGPVAEIRGLASACLLAPLCVGGVSVMPPALLPAILANAHADLFDALGVDVFIQRGTGAVLPVRVVVEDGVARVGEYGQVIGRDTFANFLRAQWIPARGDVLAIDVASRKVDSIDTGDGIVVRVVLHG